MRTTSPVQLVGVCLFNMTYKEQLKDQRWLDFRNKAFKFYEGCGCVGCGDYSNKEKHEIHHIRYIKGRMAWEYEMKDVIPLCRGCHELYHKTTEKLTKLVEDHCLMFPMDFIKVVDLFEIEINKLKQRTNGEF